MKIKCILSFTLLILLSPSFANAQSCVEAGGSVGVYPNAPECCSGLILAHSASNVMGSAGKCVKKGMGLKDIKFCVEAGGSVGVSPEAPECCSGLILAHSASNVMGSAGKCVKKGMGLKDIKSCVEAGGSVGVYPNAPECCSGLMLAHSASDVMGSAGKCIKVGMGLKESVFINACHFTSDTKILCPDGKVYNSNSRTNTKSDLPAEYEKNSGSQTGSSRGQ